MHSIPDGTQGLLKCLEDVLEEIRAIETISGGIHPTEDVVEGIVSKTTEAYNKTLIASASTRQYESPIAGETAGHHST